MPPSKILRKIMPIKAFMTGVFGVFDDALYFFFISLTYAAKDNVSAEPPSNGKALANASTAGAAAFAQTITPAPPIKVEPMFFGKFLLVTPILLTSLPSGG
jgi:hypothetical protein